MGHGLTVIDVTGSQIGGQQVTTVIDDQVQLEAVEPAHRGLAPRRQTGKHLMAGDAPVVADGDRCGVNEGNARDWSQACLQVVAQRQDCLLYTSPSPRDRTRSRMPSSA